MKNFLLLKMAVYNVATKKLRAMLTVGGIGISVALMIVLMGFGSGLESLVTEQITRTEAQNVLTVSSKTQQLQLDQETVSQIASISGVSETEEIVGLSGQVSFNNSTLNLPIYAVSDGYLDVVPLNISAGEKFPSGDTEARTILVSEAAMKAFKIDDFNSVIDRPMQLRVSILRDFAPAQEEQIRTTDEQTYTIGGVIANTVDPVAYVLLEPLRTEQVTVVSQLKLRVSFTDKIPAVREAVEQLGYQTSSITDSIEQVERIFSLIKNILVYFGVITVLVAVFSTLNTITIELIEQTRQISFLRIMGISKREVGFLFIIQSILLSVTGTFLGIVLGLSLGFFANGMVAGLAGDLLVNQEIYIFKAPLVFISFLLLASFGIGWAIGIVPSKRAVRIRPLIGAEQ